MIEWAREGDEVVQAAFRPVLDALTESVDRVYGRRLVGLAVFGSVGRGTARPDSDVDLLVVARELPAGRLARMAEFAAVERMVSGADCPRCSRLRARPSEDRH